MTTSSKKKAQSEKFIEKAREFGCEEDEAAFDRTLKRIVPKQRQKSKNKGR